MTTASSPVEFTRELTTRRGLQRAGNRVQLEDTDGTAISPTNPIAITDTWSVELASDETLDDNDKTILTVPAGEEYQILWIWIDLTTTATVGDRQLVVEIQDTASDVIAQFRVGIVQAASLTRYYMLAPALSDLTTFRDTDWLMTPLPPTLILQAGDQLRIYENNNVSGSDDLILQVQYAKREV